MSDNDMSLTQATSVIKNVAQQWRAMVKLEQAASVISGLHVDVRKLESKKAGIEKEIENLGIAKDGLERDLNDLQGVYRERRESADAAHQRHLDSAAQKAAEKDKDRRAEALRLEKELKATRDGLRDEVKRLEREVNALKNKEEHVKKELAKLKEQFGS
jgi:chromosome segregation ATPase